MATGDLVNLTIMYSMPRSMTQWWRWFFSRGCHSLHDPLARCRHPGQLRKIVEAAEGEPVFIADTSAIYFHDRLQQVFPGHRRLYMLRDINDVFESIRRQGGAVSRTRLLDQHVRLLQRAWGKGNNTRLHYGDLDPWALSVLYEIVTGTELRDDPAVMLAHRVDTPLRLQHRNPDDIRSLLSYKDLR